MGLLDRVLREGGEAKPDGLLKKALASLSFPEDGKASQQNAQKKNRPSVTPRAEQSGAAFPGR